MKLMSIHINQKADLNTVWIELENLHCEILYSSESDDGNKIIYAKIPDSFDLENYKNPNVVSITPYTLPEIDWTEQYKNHGLNFYDGLVHVDLYDFGFKNPLFNPIKIEPGPGFGDLSHPTTKMMIRLMSLYGSEKNVIDIGSGSGILSFVAVSSRATSIFGIDIDEEAIIHARKNSQLNGMENQVSFGFAKDYKIEQKNSSLLILMNMIQSEQMEALESLKEILKNPGTSLTSGILKKDRERYLTWTKSLNWTLLSELEEEGWLSFHFLRA